MHFTALLSLTLAIAVSYCLAASYHKASPPNVIVLEYSSFNVPATANWSLQATLGPGNLDLPGEYYGFAWNSSVSIISPNGTKINTGHVSNVMGHSDSCSSTGGGELDSVVIGDQVSFGTYVAISQLIVDLYLTELFLGIRCHGI